MAFDYDVILDAGRRIASIKAPYMSRLMFTLTVREQPGLGTTAVNKFGVMYIDPDHIATLTPSQMAWGWGHEVLHVYLGHTKYWTDATIDHKRMNIAMDLAIFCMLRDMGFKDPYVGVYTPEMFKFPTDLSAVEYYALLEGKTEDRPGDGMGRGKCGSCAGNGDEPQDGEDPAARSEAEIDRARKIVAEETIAHQSSGRGTVPGSLLRIAGEYTKPAKIRWQDKLSAVTRKSIATRKGYDHTTFVRPHRMQSGVGYGMGCPIFSTSYSKTPSVGVLIDTSGSMGTEQFGTALQEIGGILRSTGAKITVMSCDAHVHAVGHVGKVHEVIPLLQGGGGSDFNPAFDQLEQMRNRPDVLIVFTDGYIGTPDVAPDWAKVVWVLVGGCSRAPAAWGESIVID